MGKDIKELLPITMNKFKFLFSSRSLDINFQNANKIYCLARDLREGGSFADESPQDGSTYLENVSEISLWKTEEKLGENFEFKISK